MKLLRYGPIGKEKPGLLDDQGRIRDLSDQLNDLAGANLHPTRLAALSNIDTNTLPVVEGTVRFGAPVAHVGKIIGIGLNYADHASETGMDLSEEPIIFSKAVTALSGPNDQVVLPKGSSKGDWEVELAIIIGQKAKYISQSEAFSHIAGYAVFNDISERTFQLESGGQWVKGKSFDTSAPLGPWLVTADEITDPQNLKIWLELNGVLNSHCASMQNFTSPLTFDQNVGGDGVWVQLLNRAKGLGLRPTLFLDRDGVILVETNYLHKVEDTQLIDGAAETIHQANIQGCLVVIVTNQSGIGRGIYGWSEFAFVQEKMVDDLANADAYVNAVLACPFHCEGNAPWDVEDHPDRKPRPGMLIRAGRILPIDYSRSWIIGDHASDLEAGKAACLQGGMHVLSGHGLHLNERENARNTASDNFVMLEGGSIADVIDQLPIFT